jgi:hypothetical protein
LNAFTDAGFKPGDAVRAEAIGPGRIPTRSSASVTAMTSCTQPQMPPFGQRQPPRFHCLGGNGRRVADRRECHHEERTVRRFCAEMVSRQVPLDETGDDRWLKVSGLTCELRYIAAGPPPL